MQKLSTALKKYLKYLSAIVLLAIPLYPKFPLINIPNTYVSVRLEDFVLLIVSVVIFLIILPNIKSFLKDDLIRAMLLYLLVGGVSLLSGIFLTKTVTLNLGILNWLRRVEYFTPFFLGFLAMKHNRKDLEFYLKIIVLVVVISFAYGLGQRYFSFPVIITQNEEYSKGVALRWIPGSHINSTFAGHYDLASFLVLVMPIIITSIFILKGNWTRIILSLTALSGMWLLVNTASRISFVSYILSVIISLVIVKKYKAIVVVFVLSLIFILSSSNLISRYVRIFDVIKEKIMINYIFEPVKNVYAQQNFPTNYPSKRDLVVLTPTPLPVFEDRSTSIRLNVEWPRAMRAMFKNPLLGTGFSSITLATDNDLLRALGETGILGLLSFLLIFLIIFKKIINSFPLDNNYRGVELAFYAGLAGSIPGIFINALFIDIFEASKLAIIFWLLMGFLVSLSNNEKNIYSN